MAIKRTVKTLSALLLTGLLLEGGGYLYGLRPSDIYYHYTNYAIDIEYTKKKLGLIFKDNIEEDYPYFWERNGIDDYQIKKIDNPYEQSRLFRIVKKEIKKIPEKVIIKNIRTIYGLGSIYFGGLSIGGTYSPTEKELFISLRTEENFIVPERFIKNIFHHEISSILMKNYSFSENKWRDTFDDDFLYRSKEDPFYYIIHLQGNADKISESELYSRGLLKQYAETGMENDFNTYAEVIFTEPCKMKKLITEYPVIKRKYEVFKAFYLSIDPGFAPVFEKIDG